MGDYCVDDTKQRRGSDSPVSVGLGELKKKLKVVSFLGWIRGFPGWGWPDGVINLWF